MAQIPMLTGPERNGYPTDEEKYDAAVDAVSKRLRKLRLWPLVSELKVCQNCIPACKAISRQNLTAAEIFSTI